MHSKGTLLITGGRGMVGRNVSEAAERAGWTVVAPPRSELDLFDYRSVLAFFRRARPDVIVHAAGRVGGIQANIASPVAFLVENVDVGRNVLLAAREACVANVLNLASSCMYPREAHNPLAEELVLSGRLEPTNEGYALAKIFATKLCEYIGREDPALNYKTLIPCNLYGLYDKFDAQTSHLVPAIIRKVHAAIDNGHDTVDIWGDGTARREFMFAGDLADAILHAIDDLGSLPPVMNIGLGFDYSINDYYAAVAAVAGWQGRFSHDLTKPVGMKQKLVDTSLQSAWGWSPSHSLTDGLRKTYEHYLEIVRR
ncbi:MAG: NAD-dependent epimerase/dehydratase family protein [Bradyrhizobium sp.]|nr:NAD-dependent epimerase/dehydratase family protein [Bradyrhizobium sp.]